MVLSAMEAKKVSRPAADTSPERCAKGGNIAAMLESMPLPNLLARSWQLINERSQTWELRIQKCLT